jgi:hypothetical protein
MLKALMERLTGPRTRLEERLATVRRREALRSARLAARIRDQLLCAGVALGKSTDRVPTDLADIHEACRLYIVLMRMLRSSSNRPDRSAVATIFQAMFEDLYLHLPYHLRGMRKPLELVIGELERDDRRGGKKRRA